MIKILVCSSSGGGNFHSLIQKSKVYKSFVIEKLIVDRVCGAVQIANASNVEVRFLNRKVSMSNQLLDECQGFDLVVLAGFMPIVSGEVIESVNGRIINTHPSLLPKHGGKGMYGVKVQESVLNAGDMFAGCTVHQVNSRIDEGLILAQTRLLVPDGIDPWTLGGLVHNLECELLPSTVHRIAVGEITLEI